ncbi:LOW QUALITY PROTEIN: cystatin-like [Ornithorhynchus anatinus]|uniref:LOW QUALITY PROTEIN: cystatin-like n=1 Tax=Ornithorhynchus anatinus TaxID=9258 RepID=UPI0010A91778|nr:LOW QUALITY PROTEIN: cystatin-like [Ornithorhynchus anatinus]
MGAGGCGRCPLVLLLLGVWGLVCAEGGAEQDRPRLLGGALPADENEEGVQRALQFAMGEYNRASNDKYGSRVARLVQAHRQIVAGVKYYLDVEIGRTTCTKSVSDLASCPFHDRPELKKQTFCSFEVLSVPWLSKTKLLKNNCKDM